MVQLPTQRCNKHALSLLYPHSIQRIANLVLLCNLVESILDKPITKSLVICCIYINIYSLMNKNCIHSDDF